MLRKNVAGQFLYFAGIDATTGGALTGATFSARRAIDGTFAAGGGTITEDTGLGFYKCALSQADTNGNDLAFFFTATGAIPVCINALTTAADPSDAADFGLTNLDAAITSRMATYTQPTGFLAATFPSTVASTTNITAGTITTTTNLTNLPAITAGWLTAAGIAAGALNGKGDWNIGKTGYSLTATTGLGNQTSDITGSLSGSVGSVTGLTAANLDVAVSTRMATYTQPIGFLSATFPASLASVIDIPTAVQNADALLDRNMATGTDSGSPSVRTPRQALRFLRNKWSVSGATLTVTKEDDAVASWTATVTTDAGAVPIVGNDPA